MAGRMDHGRISVTWSGGRVAHAGAASVGGVSASAVWAVFCALLRLASVAAALAPGSAAAQQTSSLTADSSAATLPEIRVIELIVW